jgi:hypothetical protein
MGQVGADIVLDRDRSVYAKDGHPLTERLKHIETLDKLAPGSPKKAAEFICEVALGEEELRDQESGGRLLRFILGDDSWKGVNRKVEGLRRTLDVQQESCKRTNVDA